jgi:hypothetical protein
MWALIQSHRVTKEFLDMRFRNHLSIAPVTGNPNTNWTITAKTYIKEAIEQVERRSDVKIREEKLPMKPGDHPEEDTSPLLDNEQHRLYQSMIRMSKWTVSIGHLYVMRSHQ